MAGSEPIGIQLFDQLSNFFGGPRPLGGHRLIRKSPRRKSDQQQQYRKTAVNLDSHRPTALP